MSSTPAAPKRRYRTTNWKQYNAALKARGSLTVWFDKSMSWFATASGKRGRSPKCRGQVFSDSAAPLAGPVVQGIVQSCRIPSQARVVDNVSPGTPSKG